MGLYTYCLHPKSVLLSNTSSNVYDYKSFLVALKYMKMPIILILHLLLFNRQKQYKKKKREKFFSFCYLFLIIGYLFDKFYKIHSLKKKVENFHWRFDEKQNLKNYILKMIFFF